MSEIETFLYTWIPVFTILGFCIIGLVKFAGIRSQYKIKELSQTKQDKKKSESFGGALTELIDSAPKNLAIIESEIATIREKAIREKLTPQQTKELLSRLESEKDMLKLGVKYGHLAKPLAGKLGGILEKVFNQIG